MDINYNEIPIGDLVELHESTGVTVVINDGKVVDIKA